MQMFRTFALVLSFTGLGALMSQSAYADDCSSVDSCARTIACPSGMNRVPHPTAPNAFYCTAKKEAQTLLPICTEHNKNTDWTYDAKARNCTRTRDNGIVVTTRDNVACPAGSEAVNQPGQGIMACKTDEVTTFSKPTVAKSGTVVRPIDAKSDKDATAMIVCQGAIKKTGESFFCELHLTADRVEEPECERAGGNTWTWDAAKKACKRTNNGETLYNPNNIRCPAVGAYNAGTGKCVTTKGTYYAAPVLVDAFK